MIGVVYEKDHDKAIYLYEKAAELDDTNALNNLGALYEEKGLLEKSK